MCGICGMAMADVRSSVEREKIERMCRLLAHRGPDDEGIRVQGNVGLGMRRLRIIDLEGGAQPQSNEDGSLFVVFNGEIYNFQDLRKSLIARGHRFKTRSDTEVILHAYEEHGEACLDHLNGMFAFALHDAPRRRLFLARDRLGIKPLYYRFDGKVLCFASELKAVLAVWEGPREIDPHGLDLFLTLEYVPSPGTLIKGLKKLPPGHALIFQDGAVRQWRYWDLTAGEPVLQEGEALEGLRFHLDRSVKRRLVSDVPLGAFLSGGIDSSAVVSSMAAQVPRPVKTFSIGFEESTYNELAYAREAARRFRTDHREAILKPDAEDLMGTVMDHLDDPIGDSSVFPTFLVSRMAREEVTVILSGDGGDELFGGYDTYLAERLARLYGKLPLLLKDRIFQPLGRMLAPSEKKKGAVNRIKRFLEGAALNQELAHMRWMVFLHESAKAQLYREEFARALDPNHVEEKILGYFRRSPFPEGSLESQLYVDLMLYLPEDILTKVDRMSMAASLEVRVPFLDHELVEFVARIPGTLKIRRFTRKYILKRAMAGTLPPSILKRGKEGFSIPLKNWLRKELRPMLTDLLSPERIAREGFFNPSHVEALVREHLQGVQNHSHLLWALMVFELWRDRHFKG